MQVLSKSHKSQREQINRFWIHKSYHIIINQTVNKSPVKCNTALCCLDGELRCVCVYLARSLSLLRCWKKEGSQISCSSWHICLQDFPAGASFTCKVLRGGHITWPWQKSCTQTPIKRAFFTPQSQACQV